MVTTAWSPPTLIRAPKPHDGSLWQRITEDIDPKYGKLGNYKLKFSLQI